MKAFLCLAVAWVANAEHFGVDCSFPIHSQDLRCGDILGNKAALYESYMQGCRDSLVSNNDLCDAYETERLQMNKRQPQSYVNYTNTGYAKIRAPDDLMAVLTWHWERNKDSAIVEKWGAGNIYTNNWECPTTFVSVEDPRVPGAGVVLKNKIWDAAKNAIEEWTGMEMRPSSLYGIRVYHEGAILSPHVDRIPLVSSAIVNVAQDVDEPWPLEVYDRQGNAVNVTMEPGDMVLYESGSTIHGRPFPLKGNFYANVFIHFEPTGKPLGDTGDEWRQNLDDFLPPYVIPGSPEVENFKRWFPRGWDKPPDGPEARGESDRPTAHNAAYWGDIDTLAFIAAHDKDALHQEDEHGWLPVHEASRSGEIEAVKMLLALGVDVNARVNKGKGPTPLYLALENLEDDHPLLDYLEEMGGVDLGFEEEL